MNSVTQQDWTNLGADLQQELRQHWNPSQPLQLRCAIRDGSLLVLAEHLLHVEPNPSATFASLEQEIRRLVPELLPLHNHSAASKLPSELPIQLFLRIAGYQQPYASFKFQLDLRRSPTVAPSPPAIPIIEKDRLVSPVEPGIPSSTQAKSTLDQPVPSSWASEPDAESVTDSQQIIDSQQTEQAATDESELETIELETTETVSSTELAEPQIETIIEPGAIDPLIVGDSSIDRAAIVSPAFEDRASEDTESEDTENPPVLEAVPDEPTLETVETGALETTPDLPAIETADQFEEANDLAEFESEAYAALSETVENATLEEITVVELPPALAAEPILETPAIAPEPLASAPEPLTFEALFSEDPAAVVETSAPEDLIDRTTTESAQVVEESETIASETADIPHELIQASTAIVAAPLVEAIEETQAGESVTIPAETAITEVLATEAVPTEAGVTEAAETAAFERSFPLEAPIVTELPLLSTEPAEIALEAALESLEPEAPESDLVAESIETPDLLGSLAAIEQDSPRIEPGIEPEEAVEESLAGATDRSGMGLLESLQTSAIEIPESIEAVEPLDLAAPADLVEPTALTEPIEATEPTEFAESPALTEPIEVTETLQATGIPEQVADIAAETSIASTEQIEPSPLPIDQAERPLLATDEIHAEMPIAADLGEPETFAEPENQLTDNQASARVDPLNEANLTGTIWQETDFQETDLIDSLDQDLQIDPDWTAADISSDTLRETEATVAEIPEAADIQASEADSPVESPIQPLFSSAVLSDPWVEETPELDPDVSEQPLDLFDLDLSDEFADPALLDSEELLSEDLLPEDSIEIDNLETIGDLSEEQTVWAESDGLPDDSIETDNIETTESLNDEQAVWAESDSLPDDSIETDSIETLSTHEGLSAPVLAEGLTTDLQSRSAASNWEGVTVPLSANASKAAIPPKFPQSPKPVVDSAQKGKIAFDETELEPRRPFRWTASSLTLWGAIGAFITVSGGYLLTRPCVVGGCEPLRQAQQLSQEAIQTARTTDSALEVVDAYKKLNEANYLLSTIPSWSSYRREAQALLNSYGDQAVVLDQVVEALEQANQAAQKSQNPPHPLQEWREIQWLWREAITRLEKIPSDDPLYGLVQRKLQEYQTNLTGINQRVAIEQQAQDRITAARQIEQLGAARASAAKSPANWQETASTWTTAIDQLRQIPQGTMAYDEAQQLLAIYQPKLTEANLKRAQEQTAVDVYAQALSSAKQAQSMEQQSQWIQAATYWQAALSYAQQVPTGSTYYNQIQTLISSYRQSLQQAQQNSQRSVAIQAVKPSLEKACTRSPRLCTYTLSPQSIRVQFTALYDKTVETLINKTQPESSASIPPAIVDQVNGLLRTLADVGEATQVPIELYDSRGIKLGIYTPSLSGYVPQQ